MRNEYDRYKFLEKDMETQKEECVTELTFKKSKLIEYENRLKKQRIKIDGVVREREIIEKKIEECDMTTRKLVSEFGAQEKKLSGYDIKLQEKVSGLIKNSLKAEFNQYNFKLYQTKLLD